jgi:hypothetical protein
MIRVLLDAAKELRFGATVAALKRSHRAHISQFPFAVRGSTAPLPRAGVHVYAKDFGKNEVALARYLRGVDFKALQRT